MMKRHDDPFFEMFREGLQGYEATPSAGVQSAIKQHMAKGSFFHFAWNRLNVYYTALLLGAGIAGAFVLNSGESSINGQIAAVPHMNSELVLSAVHNRLAIQNVDQVIEESELPEFLTVKEISEKEISALATVAVIKVNQKASTGTICATGGGSGEQNNQQISEIDPAKTVQTEAGVQIQAMAKLNDLQLPIDWMNHLQSPNLSSLLTQLDSDNETIHITLPVKVTVQK
ncbi:MAG: hypothetical protein ACJAU0_001709 [Flavobacteriales bacterium]|jgi:hypothetical protein